MPGSISRDKQTNACFNLKRQPNKCLVQSQETNKQMPVSILKDKQTNAWFFLKRQSEAEELFRQLIQKRCFLKNEKLLLITWLNIKFIERWLIRNVQRRATQIQKVSHRPMICHFQYSISATFQTTSLFNNRTIC